MICKMIGLVIILISLSFPFVFPLEPFGSSMPYLGIALVFIGAFIFIAEQNRSENALVVTAK